MTDFIRDIINKTVKKEVVQSGTVEANLGNGSYSVSTSDARFHTVRGPSQAYRNVQITTDGNSILSTNGVPKKSFTWYEV